jgi:hypothetical protein
VVSLGSPPAKDHMSRRRRPIGAPNSIYVLTRSRTIPALYTAALDMPAQIC